VVLARTLRAAAHAAGLQVLHFDRHFERLGEVLGVETRWIADRRA
jgi:hypothetical protein